MERVCHLTNKIYKEMLCIKTNKSMTYINIRGLDYRDWHLPVGPFSWFSQCRIVLSLDLLAWISAEGRIPYSFTNFFTNPELSGSFYIRPDIYHAQITEYLLEKIFEPHHFFLIPDWSFWEHLSRAFPTEMIFNRLRSNRSDRLIRDYSGELMPDALEVIIKWLQGLGSERPNDLYDRFQGELLRHKKALPHP